MHIIATEYSSWRHPLGVDAPRGPYRPVDRVSALAGAATPGPSAVTMFHAFKRFHAAFVNF